MSYFAKRQTGWFPKVNTVFLSKDFAQWVPFEECVGGDSQLQPHQSLG